MNNSVIDLSSAMKFWTAGRWAEFWSYVQIVLQTVAPMLLIAFALWAVGMLIKTVVDNFKRADDDEYSYDDDDDDDRYKRKYRD